MPRQRVKRLNALCSGSQDFSTRSAHSGNSGLSHLTLGLCSGWDHFLKMFTSEDQLSGGSPIFK